MRRRDGLGAALRGAAFLLVLHAAPAAAQWRFTAGTGSAYNLPLPLHIARAGSPATSLDANWSTRPFHTPLYYVGRLERVRGGGSLGLELIHHKLFLDNPPPFVQHFEISHGFNVVTLQRGWLRSDGWSWRAGAGVVITHPETRVGGSDQPRGGWGNRGYYVSGPTAQLGAGWSYRLARRTWLGLEAKAIGAWASVPIAAGNAELWHASGHLDVVVSQGF